MADTCPICHLGHLNSIQTVLVRFYHNTLVHVPNASAHRCDVCGETFFADATLRRLDVLIGDSGPPPNHHVSTRPASPTDADSDGPLPPAPLDSRPK